MKAHFIAVAASLALLGLGAVPAKADLKLCNNTTSSVSVAIGYKDKEGWASEGWWTAKPAACISLLKGALIARYYYIYAVDREKGGSFGGKALICIKDKIFTIRGIDHCQDRGYQQQGFFEVDTGEKQDWTVSLSGDKAPTPAPAPAAPAQGTDQSGQAAPIPQPSTTDTQGTNQGNTQTQ